MEDCSDMETVQINKETVNKLQAEKGKTEDRLYLVARHIEE